MSFVLASLFLVAVACLGILLILIIKGDYKGDDDE